MVIVCPASVNEPPLLKLNDVIEGSTSSVTVTGEGYGLPIATVSLGPGTIPPFQIDGVLQLPVCIAQIRLPRGTIAEPMVKT
jgi:hypothetical protein